jgi:hypothetical protein
MEAASVVINHISDRKSNLSIEIENIELLINKFHNWFNDLIN